MSHLQAIPAGYHSVQPYLIFKNCSAAIEFYSRAFSATEELRMPNSEGRVTHAEILIGNSIVMMADESPASEAFSPEHFGGSAVLFVIYTEDCDGLYRQALQAGAKSCREPADQPYGDRMAGVDDPFGYRWYLATQIQNT